MQLLLKRNQTSGSLSRVTFDLWARFELTDDEDALINRYHVRKAILSEGNPQRDLIRAAKYGAGLGLLIAVLAYPVLGVGPGTSLLLGVLAFVGATFVIYQQI